MWTKRKRFNHNYSQIIINCHSPIKEWFQVILCETCLYDSKISNQKRLPPYKGLEGSTQNYLNSFSSFIVSWLYCISEETLNFTEKGIYNKLQDGSSGFRMKFNCSVLTYPEQITTHSN